MRHLLLATAAASALFAAAAPGRARAAAYTFATIDVPGAFGTIPYGINDAGQVVGTYAATGGNTHGFVEAAGGAVTTLDFPGAGGRTEAYGINDAGQVVGTFFGIGDGTNQGFLYSGAPSRRSAPWAWAPTAPSPTASTTPARSRARPSAPPSAAS